MSSLAGQVGWKFLGPLLLLLPIFFPLPAQSPADLGSREKTEIFIQHLVKVAKIDPSRYQALVLEYEIGNALADLSTAEGDEGSKEKVCGGLSGPVGEDFMDRALKEIHPEYARAAQLKDEGKLDEARESAKALEKSVDPYLAAHARLLLAELALGEARKAGDGQAFEKVISLSETIGQN